MKFQNSPEYDHKTQPKTGVLLVNLGTPDAPNRRALKRYLKQFLSDPRVVEPNGPAWVWWLVLNGIILNVRPGRSAKAYQTVWNEMGEGSPLLAISQRQQQALQQVLDQDDIPIKTALAMRYGNPSVADGLAQLKAKGLKKLLVLPLYPQYSATTTASVFDAISTELQHWRDVPELRFIKHYHDHPDYIEALRQSVRQHWHNHGQPEQLLMSFHGIPKRYWNNGDPYHCECQKTGRLLAESLQLAPEEYQVVFQSIFGREEWLKPYAKERLQSLAGSGVKHVQVICPGFAADCLETLEEIKEEHKGYFLDAGGEQFSYIPALNDEAAHISLFATLIKQHCQDWIGSKQTGTSTWQAYQSFKDNSAKS